MKSKSSPLAKAIKERAINRKKVKKQKFVAQKKVKKLNMLLKKGLLLSSVWDIGKRDNYAGDNGFYGNAPTQVVEQCVLRLTRKKSLVLDPMAGSGTTIDVCRHLKRKYLAYDLHPSRKDIKRNDSRRLPVRDERVDLVFLHPPYWNLVYYSQDKRDLSRSRSLDDFLNGMREVIIESKRVLKKHGHLCVLIGDVVRNGQFIPLSRKIANMCEGIGLVDRGTAIKLTNGSVSQIGKGRIIYAELANKNNLRISHDIVMFWQKA